MRTEIYNTLRAALLEINNGEIKHVDLWNHNVQFIEQETPWETPAVFVELRPINWQKVKTKGEYYTKAELSLHIVTEWQPEGHDGIFSLVGEIERVVTECCGKHFGNILLLQSETNHNHEQLVETVDTFQYTGRHILPTTDTQPPTPGKQYTRWQLADTIVGRSIPERPGNKYTYAFPDGILKLRVKRQGTRQERKANYLRVYDAATQAVATSTEWTVIKLPGNQHGHVSLARCYHTPDGQEILATPLSVDVSTLVGKQTEWTPENIQQLLRLITVGPLTNRDTRCTDIVLDEEGKPEYQPQLPAFQQNMETKLPEVAWRSWEQTAYEKYLMSINTEDEYTDGLNTFKTVLDECGESVTEYRGQRKKPLKTNGNYHIRLYPRHTRRKWYAKKTFELARMNHRELRTESNEAKDVVTFRPWNKPQK